ncbi:MAG: amidohydrolase family protein [Verrucomicrobia bacterium]|nr:amidohydrolase family protein [Verrucomicrobiota bacterium]
METGGQKRIQHGVFYFLLLILLGAQRTDAVTVLIGARIIDGTGKAPLENGAIAFDGDKITALGSPDQIEVPQGAQVVHLENKTIIPGLISAHSHLGLCEGALGPNPEHYNRNNVRHQLEQYERYGILSVMALGCSKDVLYSWREEQRRGELDGADIFTADRGFGVSRGAPPFPLMQDQVYRPGTPEEARAEVNETASRHPDMIKLWVDDLFGTVPKMSPETYDTIIARAHAIVDEAHKQGYKVAAHIFYLGDAKALVSDGINVLAHSVRDQPVDAELIEMMKAKGVAYIATLDLDESQYIYAEQLPWMEEPFFIQAVDPALLQRWRSPLYAKELEANPNTPKNKAAAAMGQRNIKVLFDAGVKIAFGTDSGALPTRIPGFAEHRELQLMVQSGLRPMDAIVCATKNSAEVIGAKDRGTLETGKLANLIVLDSNPLEDIRNTTRIEMIYHSGKRVR